MSIATDWEASVAEAMVRDEAHECSFSCAPTHMKIQPARSVKIQLHP